MSMRKQALPVVAAACAVLVLAIACAARIAYVNERQHVLEPASYTREEAVPLVVLGEGDGRESALSFTVEGFYFAEGESFKGAFPDYALYANLDPGEGEGYLFVRVTCANDGDGEQGASSLARACVQSGAWANGADMLLTDFANGGGGGSFAVEGGESKSFVLAFSISESYFPPDPDTAEYELVCFPLYPQRTSVNLGTPERLAGPDLRGVIA